MAAAGRNSLTRQRLLDSDGRSYTLAQFAGKQGVVLAWFPRAFTPRLNLGARRSCRTVLTRWAG